MEKTTPIAVTSGDMQMLPIVSEEVIGRKPVMWVNLLGISTYLSLRWLTATTSSSSRSSDLGIPLKNQAPDFFHTSLHTGQARKDRRASGDQSQSLWRPNCCHGGQRGRHFITYIKISCTRYQPGSARWMDTCLFHV